MYTEGYFFLYVSPLSSASQPLSSFPMNTASPCLYMVQPYTVSDRMCAYQYRG